MNAIRPKHQARKEVCVTRIEGVDDVEMKHEEEEFGERKTTRKHDRLHPSEQERLEHETMHFPFCS